jgi:hypothetical protein
MLNALELAKYMDGESKRIQKDLEENDNLAHAYYRSRGLCLFAAFEIAGLDPSTGLSGADLEAFENLERT